MNRLILFLIVCISISCNSKNKAAIPEHNNHQDETLQFFKHKDTIFVTTLLNIDYTGKVEVFDIPHGRVIKHIQNNIEEDDIVMFDLFQKQDSMYLVIAYSGLTNLILAKGWISQNTNLGVYSAAYGNLRCSLFKMPNRKEVIITENEYNPNIYEVLDFEGRWLKVRTVINNKKIIGWMPPEMQCANPYTTCS